MFLLTVAVAIPAWPRAATSSLRGKLVQEPDRKAALELSPGKRVSLEGDQPTTGVLMDKRLAGVDLEVAGQFSAPGLFTVDPIHTKAMFVHKGGKKLLITYWCDVCSIRTYTPGKCWCCQEETDLDLREPDKP